MARELPILPSSAQPLPSEQGETYVYSRVFCQKENSPPLRLLIDFLKSRGQLAITPPDVDAAMLDEWAWIQIALGYSQERKPIRVFCIRDRGSYTDVFEQEQKYFLEILSPYDDIEAQLAAEYVRRARFILTTQMQSDITEEGYDFNGWILEFYQEHCTGLVQVDGQGFFSPKGQLIVDLSEPQE